MNNDGTEKRVIIDSKADVFFYNDSYNFIFSPVGTYSIDKHIYRSNIDRTESEFLLDLDLIGEEYTKMFDFNPNAENLLLLIADTPRKTNIIAEYNVQKQELDTLSIADSGWVYLRPQYSNDYAKIAFIERNYDKDISNIVILENGIKKELVTDEDEWIDFHPMKFSPKDNYLAYSKNINQEGDWVWWKSYLHIVNINTGEIKFIDGDKAVRPQWNPLLPY